jgi:iron complex outermembrane receptor protein
VYGANLNSWFKWAWGKTAFGVEYRSEQILSNVLGEDLDKPEAVPGEDAQFTKGDDRNTISVFFEHAAYVNNWTLTAGLMSNYISDNNSGVNLFPGIDIAYNISEKIKFYTSYNTSLRMPTFTDLYYQGPTNIGNSELRPEKSATLEGGFKLNKKYVKGHAVVYFRKGKDIIDWVKTDDNEVWQPQNLTEINTIGTEIQTNFNLREMFKRNYPNIQLSYLYNNVEKQEADFISNYVLDNLKHKFVGSIDQQIVKNLTLNLKFVYQSREGTYTEFEDTVPVGEVKYDPFLTFDGKVSYYNEGLTIFATVNNILNIKYNDIGNVIQPGIWFKAGVSYRLNFKKN